MARNDLKANTVTPPNTFEGDAAKFQGVVATLPDGALLPGASPEEVANMLIANAQDVDMPDDPDYQPVRFAEDVVPADSASTNAFYRPPAPAPATEQFGARSVQYPTNQSDALLQSLQTMGLPTEFIQLLKQQQDQITGLQQQLDNASGNRQQAIARRQAPMEDLNDETLVECIVQTTGRYKFGNKIFILDVAGKSVDLPRPFAIRLRRSRTILYPHDMYDQAS